MPPFPLRLCPICGQPPRLVECIDLGGWHALCARLLPVEHWIAVYGATRTLAIIAWDEAWQNGFRPGQ